MVEDRQEQCFQERAIREGALNGEQGRTREVAFAFRIAPDVASEMPRRQEISGLLGNDTPLAEPIDLVGVELEKLQGLED